jgi:hypothetical protein
MLVSSRLAPWSTIYTLTPGLLRLPAEKTPVVPCSDCHVSGVGQVWSRICVVIQVSHVCSCPSMTLRIGPCPPIGLYLCRKCSEDLASHARSPKANFSFRASLQLWLYRKVILDFSYNLHSKAKIKVVRFHLTISVLWISAQALSFIRHFVASQFASRGH